MLEMDVVCTVTGLVPLFKLIDIFAYVKRNVHHAQSHVDNAGVRAIMKALKTHCPPFKDYDGKFLRSCDGKVLRSCDGSSYIVVSRRTCKSTYLPSRRRQPLPSVTLTKSTMQVDTPGHQLVSQQIVMKRSSLNSFPVSYCLH